jgi:hypothetical protein
MREVFLTKYQVSSMQGTFSKDKHEILFSRFGVNYNGLPAQFRKGSTLIRTTSPAVEVSGPPVSCTDMTFETDERAPALHLSAIRLNRLLSVPMLRSRAARTLRAVSQIWPLRINNVERRRRKR